MLYSRTRLENRRSSRQITDSRETLVFSMTLESCRSLIGYDSLQLFYKSFELLLRTYSGKWQQDHLGLAVDL